MLKLALKEMLAELIPCIEGKYILSDGGLLGLIREKDLLEHDDDLDLFLYPDSFINYEKLEKTKLKYSKYYTCDKVYNPNNKSFNASAWTEYCASYKLRNNLHNINRAQLCKRAAKSYHFCKMEAVHTFPWIDIFYLEPYYNMYKVPYWNLYYNDETIINKDLGFDVHIPKDYERVLSMLYGDNYLIEDKDFKHF